MPDEVAAAAGAGPGAPGAGAAAAPEPEEPTLTFTLDGRPARGRPGEMLIQAAERAGTYIPRFCYHPRMKSVGVCRMCLVEVIGPRGATLQPACFIAVADGMEVVTTSEKVKKAQDGVLEFLLVNHPLDCPVCDKGGECPLQDQTLAYGPGESRFIEEKRHFEKPIALSDLVLLDRERCIQCSRCTRFAEEVAGEALIDFAGRGEQVEVATFPDEPFSSYFSGNTVQICPVGALTATPYRFTARPWDLDQVESTCTECAVGCRVAVQSSANRLTRLLGIDSEPVNHGWLCDKGRFDYESVNGDEEAAGPLPPGPADAAVDVVPATAAQVSTPVARGQFLGEAKETGRFQHGRLLEPMVRKDGELTAVSWGEALAAAADGLRAAQRAGGPGAVAVLGGARLTNEAAYAWARLAKGVLGTDSVDAQLGDGLPAELVLGLPPATIDDACSARTVILLTGDLREELPVLFLRLRQAAVEGPTTLVELTPTPTSLSRYAAASLTVRPGDVAAMARFLTGDDQALSRMRNHPEGPAVEEQALLAARELVPTAGGPGQPGEGVVVILGRPSLAEHEARVAEAAGVLARALPGARFLPALRRGNVRGALDMGLAPGLLPGRVALEDGSEWFRQAWGTVPEIRGRGATEILASLAGEDGPEHRDGPGAPPVRALVTVGVELLSDAPDRDLALRALEGADFVLAVAGHPSDSLDHADVVLPAAVAYERPGTTTNIEGRVTRLGQKLVPPGQAWPDWMIAIELAAALGQDLDFGSVPDLWAEIERLAPAYRGLGLEGLDAGGDGVLAQPGPRHRRAVDPIDPMAMPGIESVERQGAPPRVGQAGPPGVEEAGPSPGEPTTGSGAAPATIRFDPSAAPSPVEVPAYDSYSLRLVATRRLYDAGSAVTGSPSLTPLVPELVVRAHPYDLDRLGVGAGDPVRVRSARGQLVLAAAPDPSVARGVAAMDFNLPVPAGASGDPGVRNGAAVLIDARAPVNDVRLESV